MKMRLDISLTIIHKTIKNAIRYKIFQSIYMLINHILLYPTLRTNGLYDIPVPQPCC